MTATTKTCQCCGGELPSQDIWEAHRSQASACTGMRNDRRPLPGVRG